MYESAPTLLKLAAKLAEVMAEVDHVEKRGHNFSQNYDYVKASDVARAIREGLAKRQVFPTSKIIDKRFYSLATKSGGAMQAVDLHLTFTFHDSETGETLDSDGMGSGTDTGDKAVYKAQTGALKYALRTAFLIPDEEDPEADETTDKEAAGPVAERQPEQTRPASSRRPDRAPKRENERGQKLITQPQINRLFAIGRGSGLKDPSDVKDFLSHRFNVSVEQITQGKQYDGIIAAIQQVGKGTQ